MRAAPREEKGPAALSATRLLGLLGDRRVVGDLTLLLKTAPDAAGAAEAALALAALGDPAGRAPVAALVDGLAQDSRFGATPGAPDPKPLAAAVETALRAFDEPAVLKSRAPEPAPTGPFVYEGWPGLGRPTPVQSGEAAPALRLEPRADAPIVVRLPKAGGTALRLTGSVVVSVRPGWSRAVKAFTLGAVPFGAATRLTRSQVEGAHGSTQLAFTPGERIETLLARGAGTCLIRRGTAVFDASCPELERGFFEVLSETVSQWWLEVEHAEGRGWLTADDPSITILRD